MRLPGVVSWKVEPGGGTTDYAVDAFYGAIREGRYTCYLRPGTYLPMMYVPDAIKALIEVAEADVDRLKHHADYNVKLHEFLSLRNWPRPFVAGFPNSRLTTTSTRYASTSPTPGPTPSMTPSPDRNGTGAPTTASKPWSTTCTRTCPASSWDSKCQEAPILAPLLWELV